jgi:hypothetical protein
VNLFQHIFRLRGVSTTGTPPPCRCRMVRQLYISWLWAVADAGDRHRRWCLACADSLEARRKPSVRPPPTSFRVPASPHQPRRLLYLPWEATARTPLLAVQEARADVPDVPTGRQSADPSTGRPWHGGSRRDAPPLRSHGVPMAARVRAGPARLGMVFAL